MINLIHSLTDAYYYHTNMKKDYDIVCENIVEDKMSTTRDSALSFLFYLFLRHKFADVMERNGNQFYSSKKPTDISTRVALKCS